MGILAWIIVGILAGWIAERVTGSNHGLLTNLIVGLIGAFIGGLLASFFGLRPDEGFWPQLVVATIGAIVFLFGLNAIRGRRA